MPISNSASSTRGCRTSRRNCVGNWSTFIQDLRDLDLKKVPAISETIDWARTLLLLHTESLDPELVRDTLNVILKFQEDIENVDAEIATLTNKAVRADGVGPQGPRIGAIPIAGFCAPAPDRHPLSSSSSTLRHILSNEAHVFRVRAMSNECG